MTLSKHTRQTINWRRIEDSALGLLTRSATATTEVEVAPIFATARQEFQKALASLNLLIRVLILFAGVAAVLSLAGMILAGFWKQLVSGVVFTGVGTAALFSLILRIQSMGRDQAMLELIPTKYELALQFAVTPADKGKLLDRFLEEVASLK